jgi:ABC-type transport system substrate-binding protein
MSSADDLLEPIPPRPRRGLIAVALLLVVALALTAVTWYGQAPGATTVGAEGHGGQPTAVLAARGDVEARIVGSDPSDWDPALQGDYGSATTTAQVFESLTAIDAAGVVQPALAQSWSVADGGRRVVFTLRPGLAFSDGSPMTAQNVVASWLRLLDPARPSPLASLLSDVVGANERLAGTVAADAVGISADGDRVVVSFKRPAAYFPAVAATPSLAVLPVPGTPFDLPQPPIGLVVSGAYVPVAQGSSAIRLEANPHYWAGTPRLKVIEIVTDLGGLSIVEAFDQGLIDHSPLGAFDAGWVRYDRDLGPQLMRHTQLAVSYYGFDTTRPPFNDARVRRAFAGAVDWHRLVALTSPEATAATSLLPPGMPGRSETDFSPVHDPAAARALLAEAGYPGGAGFPKVALVTAILDPYVAGIVTELRRELGVDVHQELMSSDEYFARLEQRDRPHFWAMTWVADYPAPQDFLGLLLESGSTNNYGDWSEPRYDAALDAAAATVDLAAQTAGYDAAQELLRSEAPVVPVAYQDRWVLSRTGLVGTATSGMGILRFAGLEWVGR